MEFVTHLVSLAPQLMETTPCCLLPYCLYKVSVVACFIHEVTTHVVASGCIWWPAMTRPMLASRRCNSKGEEMRKITGDLAKGRIKRKGHTDAVSVAGNPAPSQIKTSSAPRLSDISLVSISHTLSPFAIPC